VERCRLTEAGRDRDESRDSDESDKRQLAGYGDRVRVSHFVL
jgi:hypothetical protein